MRRASTPARFGSRTFVHRALRVAVVLSAAFASAQDPRPELAPFPLQIIRTSEDCTQKDKDDLRSLVPMALRAVEAAVPDSARLSAALLELGRQDCNRDDACLAQLGRGAGSLYAVYLQVDFDLDRNVVATGRVVRDDGRAVRGSKTVRLPLGLTPFRFAAQAALKQLLVELDVAHLPPFRPQEPVVEVKPTPTPLEAAAPVRVTTPLMDRPLAVPALIGAGAGVACVLAGTLLFVTTVPPRTQLSQGVVRVLQRDAGQVDDVQRAQTAAVVMLTIGTGLAAVGAGLFFFGPERPVTVVVPISGGAALQLSGRLP